MRNYTYSSTITNVTGDWTSSSYNQELFSVYLNPGMKQNNLNNPFKDLLPDDNEHGWHVARNLLKPLNHLEGLRQKEKIARKLNLHSFHTPPELFDANYQILEKHQRRKISTDEVIAYLLGQIKRDEPQIADKDVREILYKYVTVAHMEFHPSDVCNLSCKDCTYGHDNVESKPPPVNFPFNKIKQIAQLKPRSVNIIGGGEPTLYKSKNFSFRDMVDEIIRVNPDIKLALITNGTYKPLGNWMNSFSWVRISLDAATEHTYSAFRGKPLFSQVIRNFLEYLDSTVPYVGVSFLFAKSNIHEYAQVARFIFDLVKKEKPHRLRKVNIQYRPLRRDPYKFDPSFSEAITPEQIQQTVKEVCELAESSQEMKRFLKDQTNITAVLGGNTHPPHEFSRCYYSQMFRIVRANGDLRPCFIRVFEPDFILGNIIGDSLETIALNTLYVAACQKSFCDSHGCRQCHVNNILEQGLSGKLKPSNSPEVMKDPMF